MSVFVSSGSAHAQYEHCLQQLREGERGGERGGREWGGKGGREEREEGVVPLSTWKQNQ